MTLYFGWDVSTVVLGMCCLREDESLVHVDHVVFDAEDHRLRWRAADEAVRDFITKCVVQEQDPHTIHFIEQRLKNMGGMTTKDTLLALGAINAVVSHVIMDEVCLDTGRLHHPYPVTTQKWAGLKIPKGTELDRKKEMHVEFAVQNCPGFPVERNKTDTGYKRGMDDRADAYIAALAGLRMVKADSLPDAIPRKKSKSSKKGSRKTRPREVG